MNNTLSSSLFLFYLSIHCIKYDLQSKIIFFKISHLKIIRLILYLSRTFLFRIINRMAILKCKAFIFLWWYFILYIHLYYLYTVGRGLARYKRTPYISICFHKMIYILYLYHSHIILVLIILFFNNQIVTFKIVTFVLP